MALILGGILLDKYLRDNMKGKPEPNHWIPEKQQMKIAFDNNKKVLIGTGLVCAGLTGMYFTNMPMVNEGALVAGIGMAGYAFYNNVGNFMLYMRERKAVQPFVGFINTVTDVGKFIVNNWQLSLYLGAILIIVAILGIAALYIYMKLPI